MTSLFAFHYNLSVRASMVTVYPRFTSSCLNPAFSSLKLQLLRLKDCIKDWMLEFALG